MGFPTAVKDCLARRGSREHRIFLLQKTLSLHILIGRSQPALWNFFRTLQPDPCLTSAVSVFETNDIVLAQVGTGLDFNQVQRLTAQVFQPVLGAQRDVECFGGEIPRPLRTCRDIRQSL
jgi:hypothetical protein